MPGRTGSTEPNKLVNRQAVGTHQGKLHQRQSGALTKPPPKPAAAPPPNEQAERPKTFNKIRCAGDVVPLASLTPDPNNARLHPERNLESIKDSLAWYGQMEPLVVREQDMMIAAGNGRHRAMVEMGWTECAVTVQPMTDAEFHGFALADNRTAELARWDFEVVARIDRLLQEQQGAMVGWDMKELTALRQAGDFHPVDIGDDDNRLDRIDLIQCPECGHEFHR